MDIITARFNVVYHAGPMSASTFFTIPVTGQVLVNLSVARPETVGLNLTLAGFRVMDGGGRQIYPAAGYTDNTAALDGRAAFAPVALFTAPFMVEGINKELSGPPYGLRFEFYNEDAADFIAFVHVAIGENLRPVAVSVHNFKELIDPIGGVVQHLIERLFPPKVQ
jgi:hypothetical protein